MSQSYVDFVENLIYGNGLAPNHNHRDWLVANSSPTGTAWLEHYLDRMLAAYESWLALNNLPPVTPWDGVRRAPWDPSQDLPLGSDLDGTFTGVTSLEDLGQRLRNRYTQVASVAREIQGLEKAPFSYRYWSYVKWAKDMRTRFQGQRVFPVTTVYDRDGTPLSATPFCDAFNDLHRNWHVGTTASGVPTPGFRTTAGQRSRFGILGNPLRGEEFLRFHREHLEEIFHRWLDRTNQPHLRPVDMGRSGGWPPSPGSPQVNPPPPWAYNEAAVNLASGLASQTTANQVGNIEFGYHVNGHGQNTDIGPLSHNNYVPRFHNWHRWIDSQWWWREPRFAQSDPVTGERTRILRPVLQDGSDFPGLPNLSIVRDLSLPADILYPQNAIGGIDFTTGNGALRIKMYIRDPFDRALRLRLKAEVLDSTGAVIPALTVILHRNIGPSGDHPLDAEFTEDIVINGAFTSDDPTRVNPAVGFVNGRIRITGTLWVPNNAAPDDPAQSPDPGFVHEDVTYVDLVREKLAPEALIYQDLSSFSEDQVNSTMSGDVAQFNNAFYVVVQDRSSSSIPEPVWPPLVADEVKGLILGMRPASGLFDDVGHAPDVVLWQEAVDAPFNGVTLQLLGPPDKEDPTLAPEIPQRLTWRYAIVFNAINDAFAGLNQGDQRNARLRVTVRDRSGNTSMVEALVKLFKDANPYMSDGPTSWLSIDTRSFAIKEGETRLNETILANQPLQYLAAIIGRLNVGTTGVETFDTLPQEGLGAALEYSTEIPDPSTGTSKKIYNFALAKVRLRGSAGAQNVRAFFRLFRYSAPSLLFDPNKGYRAYSDGSGRVVPLLGFENQVNGSPLTSIPFFATPRRNTLTESMEAQEDLPNLHTYPPGPTDERVWYFGAWLDINDPNARLPSTYNSVSPNGPFSVASVQSLRTLMRDFHQCMVVEIQYDGDPTEPLASPASSDNLAQRNLSILQSANPGNHLTRTVEQSFEIDLARPRGDWIGRSTTVGHAHGDESHNHNDELDHDKPCASCGHVGMDEDYCCQCCGDVIDGDSTRKPLEENDPVTFASTFQFRRLIEEEAMSLTMRMQNGGELMRQMMMGGHEGHHAVMRKVGPLAAVIVRKAFPLVFHPTRWSQTADFTDELMIRWNNVPRTAKVYLFLPSVSAEQIVSLRNLRHAPKTVHSQGNSTLRLDVGGTTYIPIPPTRGNRIAGLLRIILPEGVKARQRYTVDVTQLRAGSTVQNGGFRIEILVRKEKELVSLVNRSVIHLKEQLSLTEKNDIWHIILGTRLMTERMRAKGLAEALGERWVDPTVWKDEKGNSHSIDGMKIRVILEKILILHDSNAWLKGSGEINFEVRVRTDNNGGIEQKTRIPKRGHHKISSGKSLNVNKTVFEGYAEDHLIIRIDAKLSSRSKTSRSIGSYVRTFSCDATKWFGRYVPEDEQVDPENLRYWKVYYRIERG